jgi:hypothetical protein
MKRLCDESWSASTLRSTAPIIHDWPWVSFRSAQILYSDRVSDCVCACVISKDALDLQSVVNCLYREEP